MGPGQQKGIAGMSLLFELLARTLDGLRRADAEGAAPEARGKVVGSAEARCSDSQRDDRYVSVAKQVGNRFGGFVAGESKSHAKFPPDGRQQGVQGGGKTGRIVCHISDNKRVLREDVHPAPKAGTLCNGPEPIAHILCRDVGVGDLHRSDCQPGVTVLMPAGKGRAKPFVRPQRCAEVEA